MLQVPRGYGAGIAIAPRSARAQPLRCRRACWHAAAASPSTSAGSASPIPEAQIQLGQIVVAQAHASLALWSLNRKVASYMSLTKTVLANPAASASVTEQPRIIAERGEERFLLEYHPALGAVCYDLLAVSLPAYWMAMLPYPYTFAGSNDGSPRNLTSGCGALACLP